METQTNRAPRALISINRCSVSDGKNVFLPNITWTMNEGEHWVVTGTNGGGKSAFASALHGALDFIPERATEGSFYANTFKDTTGVVSFEQAASIIEEEKANDESEYIEGGVDIGRTARDFIAEALKRDTAYATSARDATDDDAECDTARAVASNAATMHSARRTFTAQTLEKHPAVTLLGIESILDRGLKYLSTGEIRRTLLARALAAEPELLILDEPFEGLDVQSRENLRTFLATLMGTGETTQTTTEGADAKTAHRTQTDAQESVPESAPNVALNDEASLAGTLPRRPMHILLLMDRFDYVPNAVTHVLELMRGDVSFCGTIGDYRRIVQKRAAECESLREENKQKLRAAVERAQKEGILHRAPNDFADASNTSDASDAGKTAELISMKGVAVQWGEKRVLDNVTWTVKNGEHWLIRGPNGSGKTTLLELITGDNAQVFCNNVSLFGKRRGTGETIWELKEKMGIVSYRLHVDYRNFGSMSIENVVVSGLHDSVGLYEQVGEYEKQLARSWLDLCGFENRSRERFSTLSYGEQRAVLIARAAVKCPLLLILDEPCHGLDSESKSRILSILQTIAESGLTTLLHVTHDVDEVLPCEKHILELHPGECPMYRITESA